jgi:UDPglucose 6-dehydrogenase
MKIGIIGFGYVGKAMYELLKNHYEILIYDPAKEDSNTKEEINKCDLGIVCVPTPDSHDRCDTSIVKETIDWLETPLILIKSTVEPTTTSKLIQETGKHIVFSPEYIGEGKYFQPFWKYPHPTEIKYHSFQIFGGDKKDCSQLVDIFKKVMGADVVYSQTDSTTAECVKYMVNTWGAMKVTFANEWFEIAKGFGVDYNELRDLFLLDGRTEKIHTLVFPDKRGFDGKCFPKDLNAIIFASRTTGYDPRLLEEVNNSNKKFNKLNKAL